MTYYAFVDGSVDSTRKREDGGAAYGGACAVILKADSAIRQEGEDLKEEPSFREMEIIGKMFSIDHSPMVITNNTMELSAVALVGETLEDAISQRETVHIWTDSQYAQGCLRYDTSWNPTANLDLIVPIRRLMAKPHVQIHHLRGHKGIAWNELTDLGAKKCVELRRGFYGKRSVSISAACFYCSKFPCQDPEFGKTSSCLSHSYAPHPCRGESFRPHPEDRVEAFQWTSISEDGSISTPN